MRKLLVAAAAGASVLSGAMIAQAVQAQPYGYYPPAGAYYVPAYRYDSYGRRYFEDAYGRHYVEGPVYDAPVGLAGALLGSVLGDVPYDRYGADPNGMIARDGHVIKCKLTDDYDGRYGRYMTHRVCY
jgi:hypothetical protein